MRVLAWSTLSDYIVGNASSGTPLREWYKTCDKADWSAFADVRATFNSADAIGNKLIFNIGGNNYRLIAKVSYPHRRLMVKWIGTHAEYDRLTRKEIEDL